MSTRASSLSPAEHFMLCAWAQTLGEAFDAFPFLVGSVARGKRRYRDVDVRMMLHPDTFTAMFPSAAILTAANIAYTCWGQRATGLPIDFQFQDVEQANVEHDGPRHALFSRGWAA